ncbi:hypothetical protein K432DRAFT_446770 [Lepidopterella palustris CBS 459.81]|uniref:Ubiquitin-like protease family profile domain-containing protein n=1 Tax=Lepidopterella palustris CBS 459.81 TaxID=1314670 RepID=A0A8E2JAG6_9PEZI|nr:hypothetical protein K432DRAFT_446770 [Lepidopterella palustris CBS 459.81]
MRQKHIKGTCDEDARVLLTAASLLREDSLLFDPNPDFLKLLESALRKILFKVRQHLHSTKSAGGKRREIDDRKLPSVHTITGHTVENAPALPPPTQHNSASRTVQELQNTAIITQSQTAPTTAPEEAQLPSIAILEKEQKSPTANLKEEQIFVAATLKEEQTSATATLKQEQDDKPSAQPTAAIVIDDSGDEDNDTILLPVPTTTRSHHSSDEFAEFEHYISIASAAGSNFILPPQEEKFRNGMEVRRCLSRLIPKSGRKYWLDRNLVFAILSKLLPSQASILSQEGPPSELAVQKLINGHDFEGIKFLVLPYAFKFHWSLAVVDIQRRTITTIGTSEGDAWARYLGQAIDAKLGGPQKETWQWVAKELYPYAGTQDETNCGTMICHNAEAVVFARPVENIPVRDLRLRYLRLIVQSYEVEPRSNAFLSYLGFKHSGPKRKREEWEVSGELMVPCSRRLNISRPQLLEEPELPLLESAEDEEFASKISNSAERAGFDGSRILEILLERPANLSNKKCLRVIQYACQIGSAEVFQTLKEVLRGDTTCLPELPLDDLTMVFLQLDLVQKTGNNHVELARKRWEQYYLHETFIKSVAMEQEKKRKERKARGRRKNPAVGANQSHLDGSHQTAEHVVRQRIFNGMRGEMAKRLQESAEWNGADLNKFDTNILSDNLLSDNLLNGKKIAQFFSGYNKLDLFLLLLFPADQVLPPRLDLVNAFPDYQRSLSKPIHAKEFSEFNLPTMNWLGKISCHGDDTRDYEHKPADFFQPAAEVIRGELVLYPSSNSG